MPEYQYKGFQIVYEIKKSNSNPNLYQADGCVKRYKNTEIGQKFHTEDTSLAGAKHEIMKLIEGYIDFEWREFRACADLELEKRTN